MWANISRKTVVGGFSANWILRHSLQGTQLNLAPFSQYFIAPYAKQTLLSGIGSDMVRNVHCHDHLGCFVCPKPARTTFSSHRADSFGFVWSRPFSSEAGHQSQKESERRVPMPRSMWKGPFVDAFLLKMKNKKEPLNNKKIWSRRSVILPQFVNSTMQVYNGKTFFRIKIVEGRVGHKFGEFALTRKRRQLRTNTGGAGKKKGKK